MEQQDTNKSTLTYEQFIRQVNNAIFSHNRAIEVLEKEAGTNKEQRMTLDPVISILKNALAYYHKVMERGQEVMDEINPPLQEEPEYHGECVS